MTVRTTTAPTNAAARTTAALRLDPGKAVSMSLDTTDPPVHPVQNRPNRDAQAPQTVTLRAYEVYCHIYGSQEAMVTGGCRGGFGVSELIAFLYARSFPKGEWCERVDEAFRGMKL